MIKRWAILAALGVTIAGCSNPGKQTAGTTAKEHESGAVYHMQLHQAMDTEGTHKVAFTYLIPDGWTATDTIQWIPNSYATPEISVSTIKSADGLTQLDSSCGVWTIYSHGPQGDFGQTPPKSVSDLLIAGFQTDHPGVQFEVLTREDTPVDSILGAAPAEGANFAIKGTVKLRFTQNGKSFLMKSQARMDGMQMNPIDSGMGGTMYQGGWRITGTLAVTAPEDQMDEAMKQAGIILASSRLDPHFFNTVLQTQKIISDAFYSRQEQIGQISQIISQTNDQISDTIMSSYETGRQAEDREISGFDDYIRGVDKYQDTDAPIDLPSGYAHAFADNNGHYIVTDIHGYDPNTDSTSTWHELQKAE